MLGINILYGFFNGGIMKKFTDYATANCSKSKGAPINQSSNASAFDLLKEVATKYEGASEGDLISSILSEAKRAREEGRLTDSEIESFVYTISPMLNPAQRKQLEMVVRQIKKG